MAEVHNPLERALDPIDDIRNKFEASYTEDYYNPRNGDWISDDYYRIIDITTQPGKLTGEDTYKLNTSILRLNSKYPLIEDRLGNNKYILKESRLGGASLLAAYNDVADQINTINQADPSRINIAHMQSGPAEIEEIAS